MPPTSLLRRWLALFLAGVLGGLVLAVAALPGNLLVGITTKSFSDRFAELPASLRTPPTPQRS